MNVSFSAREKLTNRRRNGWLGSNAQSNFYVEDLTQRKTNKKKTASLFEDWWSKSENFWKKKLLQYMLDPCRIFNPCNIKRVLLPSNFVRIIYICIYAGNVINRARLLWEFLARHMETKKIIQERIVWNWIPLIIKIWRRTKNPFFIYKGTAFFNDRWILIPTSWMLLLLCQSQQPLSHPMSQRERAFLWCSIHSITCASSLPLIMCRVWTSSLRSTTQVNLTGP